MEFVDCPFTMWSPEEQAWNDSTVHSVSSFGSLSSSLATAYSSTSVSLDSEYFALHSERMYNEFRKWMSTRYIPNPDYVEADWHMFRDEWDQFVRTSLQAVYEQEIEHRNSTQVPYRYTEDAKPERKLSAKWHLRIKNLLRHKKSFISRKSKSP